MRWLELANRNLMTMRRDGLSLGVNIAMPIGLLIVFQTLESVEPFFAPGSLAPGVVLFGFAMLTMTSAMALAQDRESSLFARLLTTPLSAGDFVIAYSAPYVVVAMVQVVLVYATAALLGADLGAGLVWVALIMAVMAVLYIGAGMIIGSLVSYKAVTGPWMILLMLTIFGGVWMDLEAIGGVLESTANWFPFSAALDASRSVMLDGAGVGDITTELVWVAGSAAVVGAVAVVVFRARMTD